MAKIKTDHKIVPSTPVSAKKRSMVKNLPQPEGRTALDLSNIDNVTCIRDSHNLCTKFAPELVKMCIESIKGISNLPIDMAIWPMVKDMLDRGMGKVAQAVVIENKEEPKLLDSPEARNLFLDGMADELLKLWYDRGVLHAYIKKHDKAKGRIVDM